MNDITIHMTVQDRIPCFFFVFSASFPWSPWPILSANSSKSPPKRCVISNRFYLSPLTQTTLLSHLCYPESFLMSSCWPFLSFPSCPTAISQILKAHEVLSAPLHGTFLLPPGPLWSGLLSAFLWSHARHSLRSQPLASSSSCKFFPALGSFTCYASS